MNPEATNIQIVAQRSLMTQTIDLYLHARLEGKRVSGQIVLTERPGWVVIDPLLRLSYNDEEGTLQRLMDSLWDCGIRPTQGAGSAGQLSATQAHLQDMRTIAFKKLSIP